MTFRVGGMVTCYGERLTDTDSQRGEILQWLSREPCIEHHQQTQNGVLPGSGQWLLFDPQFKRWKDESASAILWLHGIQGSGKSKLV
jgi:hypothetical protein